MPFIQYTFVDPANVANAAFNCTAPGGGAFPVGGYPPAAPIAPGVNTPAAPAPPAVHPFNAAIANGDPQFNLPHLRLAGGGGGAALVSTPALDMMGESFFSGGEVANARSQASVAYAAIAGLPLVPPFIAINRTLRTGIVNACSSITPAPTRHLIGTPIIEYVPPVPAGPGLAVPALSRLDTTERMGLGYFMGLFFNFLVAIKSGFTFLMHLKLLDQVTRSAPGARGSQYMPGLGALKPDIIACSLAAGTIHILEAKSAMQYNGTALVGAQGGLNNAMNQCQNFLHFIIPGGGIPHGPLGIWAPGPLLFAAPAAAANILPRSRVATLAAWRRTQGAGRWQLWVTDPAEDTDPAPSEFTDGFLRIFYAQYKPYFDQADPQDLETITYNRIDFESVNIVEVGEKIGIDKRILDLLRNEPTGGYPVGYLTNQIAAFTQNYTNSDNEYDAYVSREGVYTASLTARPRSNPSRVDPS